MMRNEISSNEEENISLPLFYRIDDNVAIKTEIYICLVGSVILSILSYFVAYRIITGTRALFLIIMIALYIVCNLGIFVSNFYGLKYMQEI